MGELKKVFRPEFLNRIDEVIVFHKLAKDEISEIVELLLKRIRESMAERELSLNLSDDAKDLLVEKGWDPAMGARPLRRAIQRYIEDPLADEVLAQNCRARLDGRGRQGREGPDVEDERARGQDHDHQAGAQARGGGVGAEGGTEEDAAGEGSAGGRGLGRPDLPDEPDVLPDVPDAPPAPEPDDS